VSPETVVWPLARPPVLCIPRVAHIGTLDPADKGAFSWGAHGLSVSLHPDEWEAIARLGGRPWHLLERTGGVFLDYWAPDAKRQRTIARWGVAHGLVERRYGYVYARRWWDSELEGTMSSYHATRGEALEEAGDEGEIRRMLSHPGTARLAQRIGMSPPELDAFAALLLCYVEDEHPDLDGVWWADRHGPLSAPRGAIVPARLAHWSRRRLAPVDVEQLLGA
jgi:hypothetical protein